MGKSTIRQAANGETVLNGCMLDQAALFSVLMKIRDLRLTLIAVELAENETESKTVKETTNDENLTLSI